jgi:hypothetical protein
MSIVQYIHESGPSVPSIDHATSLTGLPFKKLIIELHQSTRINEHRSSYLAGSDWLHPFPDPGSRITGEHTPWLAQSYPLSCNACSDTGDTIPTPYRLYALSPFVLD